MNKNFRSTLILLLIVATLFSFVVFIIPIDHSGAVFWISYIAVLLAIALQIPVFKIAFYGTNKKELVRSGYSNGIMDSVLPSASIRMNSKVYGFPIFRIGYIYLAAQIIVSIIFIILDVAIDDFPVWVCLLVHILVFGFAMLGTVSADAARENIEEIEIAKRADTSFMNKLRLDVESLSGKVADAELAKAVKRFSENVRYSDPMSNEQISSHNQKLLDAFAALVAAVEANDNELAIKMVKNAEDSLKERNAATKLYK